MIKDEYIKKEKYQQSIRYEDIIAGHISAIAKYRDEKTKQYASSVETLILMCPKEIRKDGFKKMEELKIIRCDYDNINNDKKRQYDDLWQYINELLEDQNLIFKTGYIKTYQ